jgi:plastocyanin
MRSMMTSQGAFRALALVALLLTGSLASAEGWGTVKGKVTYDPKEKLPENPAVTVTADKNVCMQGKILRNEWVVDPKTKGVKNVVVWLTDVKNFKAAAWAAPIHPTLKKAPATYEIDQPTCLFAPRVIAIQEDTKVVFKNMATVAHNVKVEGGDTLGPNINQLIPPGKQLDPVAVKARFIPISYSCTIHPWMKGWIASFKHPYFAVTNDKGEFEIKNAPAGKYRLQVWQEGYGFVQKNKDDRGIVITVKDKDTTDVKVPPLKKDD